MKIGRVLIILLVALLAIISFTPAAWAFCGFYVAKADTKLYNKASQVVIARDGDRTVLTMANDYQGDVKDFALVVPVPVVLKQEQVHIGESKIIERLDAFSAPRLVEYFDEDPCVDRSMEDRMPMSAAAPAARESANKISDRSLGVTVESRFSVGEYDIVILSAKESNGLETWLIRSGYKIPKGAKQLLQPYIKQKLKFFVAKVNLEKFDSAGYQQLRPIMMAYESPRFMLPIRLGMVNSTNEQDLIVYVLSPKGQAEITNYRTVKVPSNTEIPVFVKNEFSNFYKAMFQKSYVEEGKKVAFLEYAWDMSNCDPCSAEPLSPEELKQAGVFWLDKQLSERSNFGFPPNSNSTFITRLHVRYSRDKFPEDLMFQATGDRESFQGRYVMNHPFSGEMKCAAGRQYKKGLSQRLEREAQNLAKLTGWNIQEIRKKAKIADYQQSSWWENIWGK